MVVKLARLAYVCSQKLHLSLQSFVSVNEQNELKISTHTAFCYYIIIYHKSKFEDKLIKL